MLSLAKAKEIFGDLKQNANGSYVAQLVPANGMQNIRYELEARFSAGVLSAYRIKGVDHAKWIKLDQSEKSEDGRD